MTSCLKTTEHRFWTTRIEGYYKPPMAEDCRIPSLAVEAHIRTIYQKLHLEPGEDDHRRVLAVLSYLQV